MEPAKPTRRRLLELGGAAVVGAVFGIGGWEAARYLRGGRPLFEPGPPAPLDAIIDTHVHLVNVNLPGIPLEKGPDEGEYEGSLENQARVFQGKMKEANVAHALCMPTREMGGKDPLGVEETRKLAALVPGLHPVGLADPERFDEKHLALVEEELKKGDVKALKAYLGYLHHEPYSPGYRPYYKLAAKYKIPVIFHTGDTYSRKAKVRYAHPLKIDEVAVDFPETNFVIAHMGNPWMTDTAEVLYKSNQGRANGNVWADLSGFLIGDAAQFEQYRKQGAFKTITDDVRKAVAYTERPDRFLFGSDWPLAPMKSYRDFIREMVPGELHDRIFYRNAKELFKIG